MEILHPYNTNISIEKAKDIFAKFSKSRKLKSDNSQELIIWNSALKTKFDNGVEIVLVPVHRNAYDVKLRDISLIPQKNKTYANLFEPLFLVFYFDKDGNEKMERLFIKRTEGYYESAGKKNFSGLFWFEDFDGKFIRGIQYIDGKVAKSIKDEKISNGRTTSSCNTLYVTIDYYYTTYAGGMWHGPTYSYSEVVSYLVCEEDTDPQGIEIIGGGSGGSGRSTGTSTYVMHPATDYQVFDDLCAGLNAMLALQNSVGVEINGVRTTNGK